jgi:hypothetical protein
MDIFHKRAIDRSEQEEKRRGYVISQYSFQILFLYRNNQTKIMDAETTLLTWDHAFLRIYIIFFYEQIKVSV